MIQSDYRFCAAARVAVGCDQMPGAPELRGGGKAKRPIRQPRSAQQTAGTDPTIMKTSRNVKRTVARLFGGLAMGAVCFAISLTSVIASPKVTDLGGKPMVSVATRNLYVGFALETVMTETNAVMIPFRVAEAYGKLQFTAFPMRAKAIAAEIAAHQPWFVCLQEVALFRVQSPGDTLIGNPSPAETVTYDYLAILLQELEAAGLHYKVVSVAEQTDIEMPAAYSIEDLMQGKVTDIRWTDRDVMLVRTDLPPGYLRTANEQHGTFNTIITTDIGGAPVTIKRGWCSVDAQVRGRQLRVVNTHLEDLSPLVRGAQAMELLQGPARTRLPVICAGDFNADASYPTQDAYPLFTAAGFKDAWKIAHPQSPGLTWGQEELLLNAESQVTERLDWLLFRGNIFGVWSAELTGDNPLDRVLVPANPPYLIWPSDHAGVFGSFWIR